ncbi:MAG: hypothetical protein J5486_04715 [Bacteroidaceae bacterium]|nr:hypothetical protein [Bacteroidaceae bacterium]
MATLTKEQIEAKKQQLQHLNDEIKALYNELVEAGAIELSDDDLDKASGGVGGINIPYPSSYPIPDIPDLPDPLPYIDLTL